MSGRQHRQPVGHCDGFQYLPQSQLCCGKIIFDDPQGHYTCCGMKPCLTRLGRLSQMIRLTRNKKDERQHRLRSTRIVITVAKPISVAASNLQPIVQQPFAQPQPQAPMSNAQIYYQEAERIAPFFNNFNPQYMQQLNDPIAQPPPQPQQQYQVPAPTLTTQQYQQQQQQGSHQQPKSLNWQDGKTSIPRGKLKETIESIIKAIFNMSK